MDFPTSAPSAHAKPKSRPWGKIVGSQFDFILRSQPSQFPDVKNQAMTTYYSILPISSSHFLKITHKRLPPPLNNCIRGTYFA